MKSNLHRSNQYGINNESTEPLLAIVIHDSAGERKRTLAEGKINEISPLNIDVTTFTTIHAKLSSNSFCAYRPKRYLLGDLLSFVLTTRAAYPLHLFKQLSDAHIFFTLIDMPCIFSIIMYFNNACVLWRIWNVFDIVTIWRRCQCF